MSDIWGDGLLLPPAALTASADGVEADVVIHTLLSGMDGVDASLAIHTISASGTFLDYLVSSLPIYTLEASGISGDLLSVAGTLPPYQSEASVFSGTLLSGGLLDLPGHTLVADFGWFAQNTLPPYELTGLGVVGELVFGSLVLPVYTIEATLSGQNLLNASNDLPAYIVSASGLTGGVGEAALLLPVHQLLASGFSGSVLTASNDLPGYVLVATGHTPYTLAAALTLPAYQLDAAMTSAVVAAYRTWVLNLRKRALTEYTNFGFNSFASCWGRLFAASAGGIFELDDHELDAAAPIDAIVRTGKHNFGTTFAKRMPRIYVGAAATGALEFRTITGADGRRAYLLPWNQTSDVQVRRVPIGRGPKSTYWQFEMLNRDGADFHLDVLQLHPEGSARRVI